MKRPQKTQWNKLDNAAKIFPPTTTNRDPKVFRFACELYEEVDPAVLQSALDKTMKQFPFYKSILKKGLFWYYFEESGLTPSVSEETTAPCQPIYKSDKKTLLFRVTYFKKRINLEVYHAISDGTGALHFLRTMVYYYILEKHAAAFVVPPPFDYDASVGQKRDDSFSKYYVKGSKKLKRVNPPNAYHLRGDRFAEHRLSVIEGVLSVTDTLCQARNHNVSMTVFLTAILICSIREGMRMRDLAHPVVITIPVNLRNYFPSVSARNFFGIINAGYLFKDHSEDFDAILAEVSKQFSQQLTTEHLQERMTSLSALENNFSMKIIPLVIKDFGMSLANWEEEQKITAAFSNIGRITMPEPMLPYIRLFDVFTSTNRLQACLCSFQDLLTISFTSPLISTDIQRCFFRRLTQLGIHVELSTNLTETE